MDDTLVAIPIPPGSVRPSRLAESTSLPPDDYLPDNRKPTRVLLRIAYRRHRPVILAIIVALSLLLLLVVKRSSSSSSSLAVNNDSTPKRTMTDPILHEYPGDDIVRESLLSMVATIDYSAGYPKSNPPQKRKFDKEIARAKLFVDDNTDLVSKIAQTLPKNPYTRTSTLAMYDGSPLEVTTPILGLPYNDLDKIYLEAMQIPLLDRPVPSHRKANLINPLFCPSTNIHDPDAEPDSRYSFVDDTVVWNSRIEMFKYLHKNKKFIANPNVIPGSVGIVFTAGNRDTWVRMLTSLRMLSSYESKLPIEIFHLPSESPPSFILPELNSYNVVLRELVLSQSDPSSWKNFHVKTEAILRSMFQYVIYLDSDNLPIRDPTYLVFSDEFKETGLLLWPDYYKNNAHNTIWRILGLPCRDEYETESGQIVIDRVRHSDVIVLAHHMAEERDLYFDLAGGDKDVFRFAMLALGKQWSGAGSTTSLVGFPMRRADQGDVIYGHTMLQHDFDGREIFMHANLLKHLAIPPTSDTPFDRIKMCTTNIIVGHYGSLRSPLQCENVKITVSSGPMYSNMLSKLPIPNNNDVFRTRLVSWLRDGRSFLESYKNLVSESSPW